MAIAKLRAINYCTTPTKKLWAICDAAKAIYDRIFELDSQLGAIGAEDFFELWTYIVLKASIKNLSSNLEFIRLYANQAVLSSSKLAYYYTSLVAASQFVLSLQEEELMRRSSMMEAGGQLTQHVYLTCEPQRCLEMCPEAEIVAEGVTLRGYQVLFVAEWLGSKDQFCTVCIETGNDQDDYIEATLIRERYGQVAVRKAMTPRMRCMREVVCQIGATTDRNGIKVPPQVGTLVVAPEDVVYALEVGRVKDGNPEAHLPMVMLRRSLFLLGTTITY